MPFDLNGLFESITHGVSKLPSAVVAAVILGGPTAIWLITRFVNPPDLRKKEVVAVEERLWLCGACLSINEDRLEHCYRCNQARAAESVPVVINTGQPAPRIGVAVGPGMTDGLPSPGWLGGTFNVATLPTQARPRPEPVTVPATPIPMLRPEPVIDEPDENAAVEPVILEPRVKVSTRAAAAKPPASRRNRRQPQGAGEANSKRN